jgi:hypothetical protein
MANLGKDAFEQTKLGAFEGSKHFNLFERSSK